MSPPPTLDPSRPSGGAALSVSGNPSPADPAGLLDRMTAAFERARASGSAAVHELHCVFAGRPVRVRVVGESLATEVLRPFEHLIARDPVEPPALTIDLWNQTETGVGCESLSPAEDPAAPLALDASPDGRYVTYRLPDSVTVFDRGCPRMIGWYARSDRLSLYERGRPLHAPLLLWHRDRGVQAVHAGLVSLDGRGALFGGAGGSGKSTCALSCLLDGFHYLSDDYVGLEAVGNGTYVGHSLYGSTHVEPDHLRRFPALAPHALGSRLPHEDKSLVLLAGLFPSRLARAVPIRVVMLPCVTGEPRTRARPATKGEALRRLAASSLLMLPHAGPGGFHDLAGLVGAVPCYWLDLGRDLTEIPRRVEDLLREGRRA